MPPLVKWIALAVGATTCLYLVVALDRKVNATIEQVDEEIARERAALQDSATRKQRQMARGLHVVARKITRTQRQLHIPDLPMWTPRPAE
jgi:hypothetical protein